MKTGDKVIVPAEINGYGRDLRAIPHERSEHRRFFTRRVKRPFTNAACGVTFVPENRKITCPFRNLCSFLASSGVPDLPPAASFWE